MARKPRSPKASAASQEPAAEGVDDFFGVRLDEGDTYIKETCDHCSGTGDGMGVDHEEGCLVPLAEAAEEASRGRFPR